MFHLQKRLGIDLGTANSLVWLAGEGIMLNEPTVVAVSLRDKKVLAVGHEARPLFVAHQDMPDFRTRQGTVHFHIMDARNAEYRIHAIGFEQTHKGFAG